MALKIAALGGHVIIWDINEGNLGKVADEIRESKGMVSTYMCDVSDRAAIHATAETVKNDVGKIDILINNAGIVSGKPLLECTDSQIEKCIDVNVMAHFWTTRAFLPDMIEADSGHIVTIASSAGIVGVSRLVDYCTSKFANFGFDESIRAESKKYGWNVQTTVVCPYFINTGMFKGVKSRIPILLSLLDENKVTDKIVRAVSKNKRRVILPLLVYSIWLLRLLPVSVFDAVATLLGVNESMETFTGRQ